MERQKWAIFDLDGTIADIGYRLNESTVDGKLDYKKLHDPLLIQFDKPIKETIALIKNLSKFKVKIFILTARFDSTKKVTVKWLDKHQVYFDKLIMKSKKDIYIKSDHWKEKQMHIFMEKQNVAYEQIILSSDDYGKNQNMFESWGIPCLDPNVL